MERIDSRQTQDVPDHFVGGTSLPGGLVVGVQDVRVPNIALDDVYFRRRSRDEGGSESSKEGRELHDDGGKGGSTVMSVKHLGVRE